MYAALTKVYIVEQIPCATVNEDIKNDFISSSNSMYFSQALQKKHCKSIKMEFYLTVSHHSVEFNFLKNCRYAEKFATYQYSHCFAKKETVTKYLFTKKEMATKLVYSCPKTIKL